MLAAIAGEVHQPVIRSGLEDSVAQLEQKAKEAFAGLETTREMACTVNIAAVLITEPSELETVT